MARDLFPDTDDPQDDVSSEATKADPVAAAADKAQQQPAVALVPPLEDIITPRRLKSTMYYERVVTLDDAPPPYEGISITMWVNPPSNLINAVAEKRPMLRDFLFEFIRSWNLEYEADENGVSEPVPFDRDNMGLLTEEYIGWLGEEFRRLRTNPLVKPKETSSSVGIQEKSLSGGSTRPGRNGSG